MGDSWETAAGTVVCSFLDGAYKYKREGIIMKKKNIFILLMAAFLLYVTGLTGCSSENDRMQADKISIQQTEESILTIAEDIKAAEETKVFGETEAAVDDNGIVQVKMTFDENEVLMELYDNSASRSLIAQLPLTLTFEDFAGTEKISYPPEELDLSNAPAGHAPQVGDVDCYMPWGNLAIYYKGDSNSYSTDMVPMGRIVRGIELLAAQKESFDVFLELDE